MRDNAPRRYLPTLGICAALIAPPAAAQWYACGTSLQCSKLGDEELDRRVYRGKVPFGVYENKVSVHGRPPGRVSLWLVCSDGQFLLEGIYEFYYYGEGAWTGQHLPCPQFRVKIGGPDAVHFWKQWQLPIKVGPDTTPFLEQWQKLK